MTDEQQQDWDEAVARSRDLLSRQHIHFGVSVRNGVLCDVADELERLRTENERLRRERLALFDQLVADYHTDPHGGDYSLDEAVEAAEQVFSLRISSCASVFPESEAALAEHDKRRGEDRPR